MPKPMNIEAIKDINNSLIKSLLFLVAVTSYLKIYNKNKWLHLIIFSNNFESKAKEQKKAYTINQAVKNRPMPNNKIVNCG